MTLKQALSTMEAPVLGKLLHIIPNDLLGRNSEQFTSEQFAALREVIERYARQIVYTARIDAVWEINTFSEQFFNNRFRKLCRLERVFDNTEMDILLLKELQGGSDTLRYNQSQEDRAARFGMSTTAMQKRIYNLENGKEILGHYVKINIDGRGRTAYDNTIHPVFLAMNLKEAYFLTVELRKAFKGTHFEKLAMDISADVYGQLSEYGKNSLRTHIEDEGMDFEDPGLESLINLREEGRDAIYFLKSGSPCVLEMLDGRSYTGRIKSCESGLELETQDGNHIPLPDDPNAYSLMPVE